MRFRKKTQLVRVVCSLYFAALHRKKAPRICEILQQTDLSSKELRKGIKLCSEHFAKSAPSLSDILQSKLSEVDLPQEIIQVAREIAIKVAEQGLLSGQAPKTTAALCLVLGT